MSDMLHELIPEFQLIENETLRSKVIAVWEEAIQLGGWSVEDLSSIPFTLLEPTDISFPDHVRVVCQLCLAMEEVLNAAYGDRYDLDRDILIAGALLADVGKLMEFTRQDDEYIWSEVYVNLRHPFTGVGLCFKHDMPPAVMHIIATHSWEGDRFLRQPESIIFHHADFTDFDLVQFAAKKQTGTS